MFFNRCCSVFVNCACEDITGLHNGSSLVSIVHRVSLSASIKLMKCRFTISESCRGKKEGFKYLSHRDPLEILTIFEEDTKCRMLGVTFPQNSKRMAIVMLCGSEEGADR